MNLRGAIQNILKNISLKKVKKKKDTIITKKITKTPPLFVSKARK